MVELFFGFALAETPKPLTDGYLHKNRLERCVVLIHAPRKDFIRDGSSAPKRVWALRLPTFRSCCSKAEVKAAIHVQRLRLTTADVLPPCLLPRYTRKCMGKA